jgi:hypothetical protein
VGKPLAATVPLWQLEARKERRDHMLATVQEVWRRTKKIQPECIEREVERAAALEKFWPGTKSASSWLTRRTFSMSSSGSRVNPKSRDAIDGQRNRSKRTLEDLAALSIVTPGELTLSIVKGRPSDNRYLECAIEGEVDYVVTGDKHLLALEEFQGIEIMPLREFLDRLT